MQRLFLLALLLSVGFLAPVQAAYYEYCLKWLAPNTHTLVVEAEVPPQTDKHTDFSIPAWRPGRYILQDYAGAVSHFEAFDPDGKALPVHKIDKDTWRVNYETEPTQVMVRYRYYANNPDAGSSFYQVGSVYFNPVNLFAYVPGHYDESVRLELPDLPEDWKAATGLTQGEAYNEFTAESYHEFVDCPTVFAAEMTQLSYEDQGVKFYLHLEGEYAGDEETDAALIAMAQAISREQAAVFGGYPFDTYHYIYRLLPMNLRHAVEHSNSASFALPGRITQSARSAVGGMAGITAHELWHAWNVKRIRPAALWPYDYSQQQYTRLHWFTEGVTDYYADLTLVRAGLISPTDFLGTMASTAERIGNSYAATVTSPSRSSFDSWLASSPYAHPDHRISYYTLGKHLGFLIDARLISLTDGEKRMDHLFRYLYENFYQKGEGIPEDGVQEALETLSGASWQDFFDRYVHGTEAVDYAAYLGDLGLEMIIEPSKAGDLRDWGIVSSDKLSQGILLRRLSPGSDAYASGLAVNDLLVEINGVSALKVDLEAMLAELEAGDEVALTVLRSGELMPLTLDYQQRAPMLSYTLRRKESLRGDDERRFDFWLEPAAGE